MCAQRVDQDGTKRRSAAKKLLQDQYEAAQKEEEANARDEEKRELSFEVDKDIAVAPLDGGDDIDELDEEFDISSGNAVAGPSTLPPTRAKIRAPPPKSRRPALKMERYDCRGIVIVNLQHDGRTAFFSIAHNMQHLLHADAVGVRPRPRPPIPDLDLTMSLTDTLGSMDTGEDIVEKAESTFTALAGLCRTLKTLSDVVSAQALYDKSLELRNLSVSISDVIQRQSGSDAVIRGPSK